MSRTRALAGGILIALVLGALGGSVARADGGFRCGRGQVIRLGESDADVTRKCGPPDAVRTWTETRRETLWQDGHTVQKEVAIACEEWTYDLGHDRLVRYATFETSRLARVRSGSYGKKKPAE